LEGKNPEQIYGNKNSIGELKKKHIEKKITGRKREKKAGRERGCNSAPRAAKTVVKRGSKGKKPMKKEKKRGGFHRSPWRNRREVVKRDS